MKKFSMIFLLALISLFTFHFIYGCSDGGNGSSFGSGSGDGSSSGGGGGDGLSSDGGTSGIVTTTGEKLLIEHNATDEYTGFQGFTDGQLWYELTISGPYGQEAVKVTPEGGLGALGLTGLFFKTSEPANAEVPIADVLARLTEGNYAFEFHNWDYDDYSAKLTHTIPAGPVLLTPADGSTADPDNLIVSWESVKEDINGAQSSSSAIKSSPKRMRSRNSPKASPDRFSAFMYRPL